MKKIYFLLFTFIATTAFSQELLLNGGFDNWDDTTTPTSFSKIEDIEQESTDFHSAPYSAKQTGGTSDLGQTITGIIPGTSYTITLWYRVDATNADGTDARIWSYWKNGTSNVTDNPDELRGPEGQYFDNNGNVWTEYTATVTAPATADSFLFEVRTYGSAVVYWDDFSFVQETETVPTLGVLSPSNDSNIAGSDVSIELSVQNFVVDVATGSGDGHIHYTVDGGTPVMKFDTDPIALTGLSTGEHTVDLQLVDNTHTPLDPAVTASVTFTIYEVQTLPFTESFDYAENATLASSNAWTNYFSGDDAMVIADNLSYSTLNGNGNAISFGGDGADPVVDYTPTASGTIYASFMLKVTSLSESATDGYFATLRTDTGGYESRLWINPTGATSYRIGISNGGALTEINAPTTDHEIGDTVFVVFNYDIDNDTVSAWINPALGVAQPAADITEASGSTANTFSQLLIRQDSTNETPGIVMDELRIATSWALVTPGTLSVNQFEANNFKLYPNPTATGTVNIISAQAGTVEVSVFDILGKQVISQTVNNNTLNVSQLNAGVYIVKISQNNTSVTKKLIVK